MVLGEQRAGAEATRDQNELLAALSERFAALRAEIDVYREAAESAQRRLASYDAFESSLRDSVAAALQRAQDQMTGPLMDLRRELVAAREERFALQSEIGRLREERDALQATIDALRPSATELRKLATEMFRSAIEDLLSEARTNAARPLARPVADAPALPERAAPTPGDAPPRAATQPTDVRMVLDPVRSLPQLLAIENRIQSLPAVNTLYVLKFEQQSATLRVTLDGERSRDDFVRDLEDLGRPRMQVQSARDGEFHLRIMDEPGAD